MKGHRLVISVLIFTAFVAIISANLGLRKGLKGLLHGNSHRKSNKGTDDSKRAYKAANRGSYRVYNKNLGRWITKNFFKQVESVLEIGNQGSLKFRENGNSNPEIPADIEVGQYVNGWGKISGPEECARECIDGEQPKICLYDWTVQQYRTLGGACDLCVPKTNSSLTADCQCIYGDGYNVSGITTVNRMFPGPSIQVCLGDLVIVEVANNIDGNEMTIHWHGIYQKNHQHYDGVPFITQCPIPSGTKFRYEWNAQNIGTHWWHSHVGMHQAKMLEGMIVIREPKQDDPNHELYDRDDVDNHIFLSDWMHSLPEHHYPGSAGSPIVGQRPDNLLINGQGQWLDPSTGKFTNTPLAVINVEPGLRYRFRMVNTASWDCPFQLTIQDHKLTIIAADGEAVRPVTVDTITSFPAERYDFIMNANQKPGIYWVQLRLVGFCEDQEIIQLGMLRYTGSKLKQPQLARPTYNRAIPTKIVFNNIGEVCDGTNPTAVCIKNLQSADPVNPRILTEKTDYQFFLPFTFYEYKTSELYKPGTYQPFLAPAGSGSETVPLVNGITNILPSSPLLTQYNNIPQSQICEGDKKPKKCHDSTVCECTHVLKVALDSTVELIMYDGDGTANLSHPYHLHGYGFHVMAQGSHDHVKLTRENKHKALQLDREKYKLETYDRPPVKDTLAVPPNGYTIVRFIADNPGFWFYHCHITPHLMTGMSLVIQVGDQSDFPPTPTGFPTCGNFHAPTSSSSIL